MAGISFNFKVVGLRRLQRRLESDIVKSPLAQGIRKITLFLAREIKKATPVQTGMLRSSIHEEITPFRGLVGTNVQYASFVEFGTKKMEARHMEGRRVYGLGMFGYGMKLLQSKLKDFLKDIGNAIQVKWG